MGLVFNPFTGTFDFTGSSGGGGGTISGTIADTQIAFGTAADTIGGSDNLTWDGSVLSALAYGGTDPTRVPFVAELTAPPGSPFTPVLAGAGAGNVDNGTHRYKFTISNAAGETDGGDATPIVTVVDKTTNGKITLPLPLYGDTYTVTQLNIYRTAAGGSVYKLVHSNIIDDGLGGGADRFAATFTDNVADGSLGATIPSTNTSRATQYAVRGDTIFAPYDYWQEGQGLTLAVDPLTPASGNFLRIGPQQVQGAVSDGVDLVVEGGQSNGPNNNGGGLYLSGGIGGGQYGGIGTRGPVQIRGSSLLIHGNTGIDGTLQPNSYLSSDGTAGVTAGEFKDGLYVGGTVPAPNFTPVFLLMGG